MKLKRALSCVLFVAVIFIVFEATNANDEKKKSSESYGRRRNRNTEIRRITSFADDPFLEQKAVDTLDYMWPPNIGQTNSNRLSNRFRGSYEPKQETPRPNGSGCGNSGQCMSGCCKIDEQTKRRQCSALARGGERCEAGQVKGGAYFGYCPCESGYVCEFKRLRVSICIPKEFSTGYFF